MYRRMKERIKTIASVLAVESGIITTEDMRYALAATLRHIDDVDFLRKKNAASDSAEDMVEHIVAQVEKKAAEIDAATAAEEK
mgnify:CR=1 FL=1